jgi:hypothetical protein
MFIIATLLFILPFLLLKGPLFYILFYILCQHNEQIFIDSIKKNPVSYEYFISSLKILLKEQEYFKDSFNNYNRSFTDYVKFYKELLELTSNNELIEIHKQLLTCNYPKNHEEYLQLLKLLIKDKSASLLSSNELFVIDIFTFGVVFSIIMLLFLLFLKYYSIILSYPGPENSRIFRVFSKHSFCTTIKRNIDQVNNIFNYKRSGKL